MTEKRRKRAAIVKFMLLADFTELPLVSLFDVSSVLFLEEELDVRSMGAATSQKDLALKAGASTSGSKIVEISNAAFNDSSSMQ